MENSLSELSYAKGYKDGAAAAHAAHTKLLNAIQLEASAIRAFSDYITSLVSSPAGKHITDAQLLAGKMTARAAVSTLHQVEDIVGEVEVEMKAAENA